MLAEESERALDEQRRQLAIKNDELHTLEQTNFRLEQKLSNFDFILQPSNQEIPILAKSFSHLLD